jgi:hypothetical protein
MKDKNSELADFRMFAGMIYGLLALAGLLYIVSFVFRP